MIGPRNKYHENKFGWNRVNSNSAPTILESDMYITTRAVFLLRTKTRVDYRLSASWQMIGAAS